MVCPPLGYEALFAYITLGELAASIARAASAVVMTFDYDGTADSAGSDTDDDRVPLTLASIHHALDHLKSLSEVPGPLISHRVESGRAARRLRRLDEKGRHGDRPVGAVRERQAFLARAARLLEALQHPSCGTSGSGARLGRARVRGQRLCLH